MLKKRQKKLGKESLQRIIQLCKSIEERGVDPFLLDIDNVISMVHDYFPEWKNADELCLDAEALHQLASVIKFQSEWIKYRSTSLYTDPFLIEEKLRKLSRVEISELFLRSWHPIVELEQISATSLAKAIEYWQNLTPIDERWLRNKQFEIETGHTTSEELRKQHIIAEEFSNALELFWQELKKKTQDKRKIEYWDFVGATTFKKTVERAYMTSFLITYGYATLEIDRLEEVIYILPHETQITPVGRKQAFSVPIPITFEEWMNWKRSIEE